MEKDLKQIVFDKAVKASNFINHIRIFGRKPEYKSEIIDKSEVQATDDPLKLVVKCDKPIDFTGLSDIAGIP
jgi:hypothetical protein